MAVLAIIPVSLMSANFKREEGTCFPINNKNFIVGNKSLGGISESDFNQTLNEVQMIMGPLVKKMLDKDLVIIRQWTDPTVDAYATRDDDNNRVIVINGGLARHPLMTPDGFLLLICHELGHHLGGAPKILRGNSGLRSWSSAEGQADYYATSKCLPRFFNKIDGVDTSSVALRIISSGLTVSQVFASLVKGMPQPSLHSKDSTKVGQTLYNHPNPQCRLDTYLSGANCDLDIEIPFDSNDPNVGACMKDLGKRPLCWFNESDFIKPGFL